MVESSASDRFAFAQCSLYESHSITSELPVIREQSRSLPTTRLIGINSGECWCQSVTTSTLAEPKTVPLGFVKSTTTSLLGLLAIAAVAVTKTEKLAVAPGANEDSVTVDAGAARHWPVEGFVSQMVT